MAQQVSAVPCVDLGGRRIITKKEPTRAGEATTAGHAAKSRAGKWGFARGEHSEWGEGCVIAPGACSCKEWGGPADSEAPGRGPGSGAEKESPRGICLVHYSIG